MPRPADLQADPGLPQVTVRCDPCNDLVLFDRYLSCPGASRQSRRDGPVDLQLVWVPEGGRPTAPTPVIASPRCAVLANMEYAATLGLRLPCLVRRGSGSS